MTAFGSPAMTIMAEIPPVVTNVPSISTQIVPITPDVATLAPRRPIVVIATIAPESPAVLPDIAPVLSSIGSFRAKVPLITP